MDRVIFVCVHNAGRSQMAAAFFNQMADPNRARAISAGTQPGERVHPEEGQSLERVREIHDVVNGLVREMIEANGWAASGR